MFFRCSKCKETWQYPVGKCPECFSDLERTKPGKARVIGVSKVSIPTIFHAKIPYFVLLLEDERGNKWVQKSAREYKIGDELATEASKDKNAVAVWRVKYDYLEAIEKTVDLLGGLEVKKEAKVLILPTLISPKHAYFGYNTSPEFLETVIKYLQERGIRTQNVKVAGQSFDEIPIGVSAQKSRLIFVCQNFKINPLDLAQANFVKKESLEISEEVFAADLVINLAAPRTGRISAAENLFRFLKKENYLGLKYLLGDEEIYQSLAKTLPPILTVIEAQNVQKKDKFMTYLGLVLAGYNALSLDVVFAEITLSKLPENFKNVNIMQIPILGRKVEEVQLKL